MELESFLLIMNLLIILALLTFFLNFLFDLAPGHTSEVSPEVEEKVEEKVESGEMSIKKSFWNPEKKKTWDLTGYLSDALSNARSASGLIDSLNLKADEEYKLRSFLLEVMRDLENGLDILGVLSRFEKMYGDIHKKDNQSNPSVL